jgi:hypothetical protein
VQLFDLRKILQSLRALIMRILEPWEGLLHQVQ